MRMPPTDRRPDAAPTYISEKTYSALDYFTQQRWIPIYWGTRTEHSEPYHRMGAAVAAEHLATYLGMMPSVRQLSCGTKITYEYDPAARSILVTQIKA